MSKSAPVPDHRAGQHIPDSAFEVSHCEPERHPRVTDQVVRLTLVGPDTEELAAKQVTVPRPIWQDLVKLAELHSANLDTDRISWGEVRYVAAALKAGLARAGKVDKSPYAVFHRYPEARDAAHRVLLLLERGMAVSITLGHG